MLRYWIWSFIVLLLLMTACSSQSGELNSAGESQSQNISVTSTPFMPLEKPDPDLQSKNLEGSSDDLVIATGGSSNNQELSLEDYLRRTRGLMEHAERIEEIVNQERESQGLPALTPLPTLRAIAFFRANDMAVRGYLSHADPNDGSLIAEGLLIQQGFSGKLGELIWQSESPLDALPVTALDEWISDPMQKKVIDDPVYQYTGAGLIWDGTAWKIVQVFAENAP
jgi:uncharacterized protein YkwD